MTFARSLLLYPLMAVVFFGLDMVWLGVVAKGFYARELAHLMSPTVKWAPAFVFYGIFLVGVEVFVVLPGSQQGSAARTALLRRLVRVRRLRDLRSHQLGDAARLAPGRRAGGHGLGRRPDGDRFAGRAPHRAPAGRLAPGLRDGTHAVGRCRCCRGRGLSRDGRPLPAFAAPGRQQHRRHRLWPDVRDRRLCGRARPRLRPPPRAAADRDGDGLGPASCGPHLGAQPRPRRGPALPGLARALGAMVRPAQHSCRSTSCREPSCS